jgi:hypothetical protein
MTETIIGRIGFHPSRPERLALIRLDGTVSNYFALDATREHVAAVVMAQIPGALVADNGTITRPR